MAPTGTVVSGTVAGTTTATPPDVIATYKWQQEYSLWRKRMDLLNENLTTCFNLIWRQCSNTLQNKVKEDKQFI